MVAAFIPAIWAARFTDKLRKGTVWAQLTNDNYEGEIQKYGDTVKIPSSTTTIAIGDYTENTDITNEDHPAGATQDLLIDQQKYFNFYVDDIVQAQSRPALVDDTMAEAVQALLETVDTFVHGLYAPGAATARSTDVSDALLAETWGAKFFAALLKTGRLMDTAHIPRGDRWIVVHPDVMEAIDSWVVLHAPNNAFLPATQEEAFRTGFAGRMAGFRIYVSQELSQVDSNKSWQNIASYGRSPVTFADQVGSIETYRPEKRFGDGVKGLYVYGGKLVHPARVFAVTTKKAA